MTSLPTATESGAILRNQAEMTRWMAAVKAAIIAGGGGGPPTGPAGGDLTGTYPNPTIKSSVALSGSPTTTTQSPGDNSTKIATTAYADATSTNYWEVASSTLEPDTGTAPAFTGFVVDVGGGTTLALDGTGGGGTGLLTGDDNIQINAQGATKTLYLLAGGNVAIDSQLGGNVQLGASGTPALIRGIAIDPTGGSNGDVLTRTGAGTIALATPTTGPGALTNTHLFVGNASNVATDVALSGDATLANTGAITLKNTGPGATGPIGDGTHVAAVTIDAQGRVTALSSVAITGAAPTGSAGGDLTGTYPNPTLGAIGSATGPLGTAARTNTVTIDAKGRVTALTDQAIALAGSQITSGTVPIAQIPTGTTSTTVPLGGVITGAGPQGDASHTQVLTYNNAGQLTAVTNTAIGSLNASAITAGTMATARLGSGTASSATALGGDQIYHQRSRELYSAVNGSAVASISTSASLLGGAITAAIPAGTLQVGDLLIMEATGIATNSSGSTSTMTFDFALGGTISGQVVALSVATGQNRTWQQRLVVVVSAIGASGLFTCSNTLYLVGGTSGQQQIVLASSRFADSSSPTWTLDTTANISFDLIVNSSINNVVLSATNIGASLYKVTA